MFATLSLFLAIGTQGVPLSARFSNPELNFTFEHPKAWKVVTSKKAISTVTIPLPEGQGDATMVIYAMAFERTPELWLTLQSDVAVQMKAELERQWTEELLGVPLLLTKTHTAPKGVPTTVLQGLLFSATPRKLLFRLSAGPSAFPAAEAEWRKVWPSFRTVDGTSVKPEDPNRVPEPAGPKAKPIERPSPINVISGGGSVPDPVLAPVAIDCTAAGRKLRLRVPEGWSGTIAEDGAIELKSALVSRTLRVIVLSTLDSDPPGRALFKGSPRTLEKFSPVRLREEPKPRPNAARAMVSWVWRVGAGDKNPMRSFDAVGQSADFYWMFGVAWDGDAYLPAEHAALLALVEAMSVEFVP